MKKTYSTRGRPKKIQKKPKLYKIVGYAIINTFSDNALMGFHSTFAVFPDRASANTILKAQSNKWLKVIEVVICSDKEMVYKDIHS